MQEQRRHDADAPCDDQLGHARRVLDRRVRRRTARTTSGCATRRAATCAAARSTRSRSRARPRCRRARRSGQWTRTRPTTPGDPALYSGAADDRDEAIVRAVAVPTRRGRDADVRRALERGAGWDFGFVQVSTDGGETYTSLACTDTTTEHRPGRDRRRSRRTCPASPATPAAGRPRRAASRRTPGQTVLLAFRASTTRRCWATAGVPPGFWVDDVTVGGDADQRRHHPRGLAVVHGGAAERRVAASPSGSSACGRRRTRITVKQLKLDNAFSVKGFNFTGSTSTGRPTASARSSSTTIRRRQHAVRAVQADGQRRDAAGRRV